MKEELNDKVKKITSILEDCIPGDALAVLAMTFGNVLIQCETPEKNIPEILNHFSGTVMEYVIDSNI